MARTAAALLWLVPIAVLAACDVGSALPGPGGDDDDDPGADAAVSVDAAPVPAYTVALDPPTATTELGTEVTYIVTVGATDFSGPVTLAATGLPASWTVTFTPATIDAVDGGTAASEMKIVIPPNGDAVATGQTLTVETTAAPGAHTATASLTVANAYTFAISTGTGIGAHFGAMSGGLLRLRAGSTLKILNSDGTGHRIHAGGGVFPHQDNVMAQGESYTVIVADGSDTFYCHTHGQGTGEVNVNAQ